MSEAYHPRRARAHATIRVEDNLKTACSILGSRSTFRRSAARLRYGAADAPSHSPPRIEWDGRTAGRSRAAEDTRIKVNAAKPGYTPTDLNRHLSAAQPSWTPPPNTQSVDDAARTPVHLALLEDDAPTGCLFDKTGRVPW
jgi:hypothetical protein